ncbi:unnamed protein product [Caenorhabditis auriculariae]|uniref:Sas10 C-terminal domain-containing protein n=1 Tax=Caenorhabditis auriculariae TaxID=2777116 RepID=A0A8S1HR66_9PELO|nr:unnamed protein product [Caenorhabditis auriculariae]
MVKVTSFHAKDRDFNKDRIKKKKKLGVEEVLNIDEDDVSGDDDEESGSDFDDDYEENGAISDNKWGKKRKDFYGSSYVDEDWGGMRDEEMEEAELEEEDALNRQRLLDKSAASIADLYDEDEEEGEGADQNPTTIDNWHECWKIFRAKNVFSTNSYDHWKNVIRLISPSHLRSQLVFIVNSYSSYIVTAAYYLKLKLNQFEQGKLTDPMVGVHPVNDLIQNLNKKQKEVDKFLYENSKEISHLVSWAKNDPQRLAEFDENVSSLRRTPRESNAARTEDSETPGETVYSGDFTEMDTDPKRKATAAIASNKLSLGSGKKKKAKTSKTKNRRKVRNVEKRVHSQVAPVRREMQKYGGETKGIRASTIKSTKLIA